MISILIPLGPGASISREVQAGLNMQTEPNAVHGYCSPETLPPRQHEAANRNYLKQKAADYAFLIDDDQVLTDPNTLGVLKDFLDTRPEIDAVTCDSKGFDSAEKARREGIGHVVMTLCLVRKTALDRVTFRQIKDGDCLCSAFNQDIGVGRIVYHPTLKATEIHKLKFRRKV